MTPPAPGAERAKDASLRNIEGGERIHEAGSEGAAWRIADGLIRYDLVDSRSGSTEFAGLALPGDIVVLFGAYAYRATALQSCVLTTWPGSGTADSSSLLQALARADQRTARAISLRSGQAMQRVRQLLGLLLPNGGTTELPPLRDIADITALTIETVSRTLSELRQQGILRTEGERRGTGRKLCRVEFEGLAHA